MCGRRSFRAWRCRSRSSARSPSCICSATVSTNLSMMALILSVGFVVDDAIVMLENIYRHVEMGEDPLTASLVGSREIGFTIVSMTLTPMLCSLFLKKPHNHGGGSKFGRATEAGFDRLLRGYDRTLQIVL